MLTVVRHNSPEQARRSEEMRRKRAVSEAQVSEKAQSIISAVETNGWDAVTRFSLEFDKAAPRAVSRGELEEARARCGADVTGAMEHAARNIHDYQRRLVPSGAVWEGPDGAKLGQLVRPLGCVGMYVPGGTAAYPSSVLMNACPAKAAGVERLIMVTPPTRFLKDEVLAAALIAGVDEVYAVGGVQAVAALAFGAGPVSAADKIVGPGNAYVQAAKRILYGRIDIDMTAGPSEVLVLADASADPGNIAADLLSQAEHDVLAACYLVTTDEKLALAVNEQLSAQIARLSRSEIARISLADFGTAFICEDLDECADCANALAPEHLELMVSDPDALIPKIRNAGALFVGAWTPEPVGDYIAGPSHVLPTAGTARFFSPLSALSFVKYISYIEYDRESFSKHAEKAALMADSEGLDAHAASIRRRL